MTSHRSNPWAGLASYQDPAVADVQLKFCGRDNESFDVARLIDDNICVTLYGKSGTGKTSLLNAGVFPRLRRQQYLPVSIRLGMEASDVSFQKCIVDKLLRTAAANGMVQTVDVVPLPDDDQSPEYLWRFFARSRFIDADGRVRFPVLVFDQFEEVFRNRRADAEVLLRQIHFMMDVSHTLDDRVVDGQPYSYDFNFRFVLSIREDDLYRLEDSIDNCYLPEMKHCRYRLRSLSVKAASDVVLIPGEGLFRPEEEEAIAATIIATARNKEYHSISTNILSLICSRIFVDWQKGGAEFFTPALVESFVKGNPFERFYDEATKGFSNREKSFIEEHFVDSEGRRNSISETDLQRNVTNWKRLVEGENRILQRTASSADGTTYRVELLHDSFCQPLLSQKEKRAKRRRLRWLALALLILLSIAAVAAYMLQQAGKIRSHEGHIAIQDSTIMMQNQQLLSERDSLQSANGLLEMAYKLLSQREQELQTKNVDLLQKGRKLLSANENLLIGQSRILSEKASKLVDEGDSYLARIIAIEALDKAYTPEAEAVLRKACEKENAVLRGHAGKVRYCTFSHNGRYIASASEDCTIRIWDVVSGKCFRTLRGHSATVGSVSFSPDDMFIVSSSNDNTIRVWDAATGNTVQILSGHKGYIVSATFDPEGKYILSASEDSTVRKWDVSTGQCIDSMKINRYIRSAFYCPDGRLIIHDPYRFKVYDADTWQCMDSIRHFCWFDVNSFSSDGGLLVTRDFSYVYVWNGFFEKKIASYNCMSPNVVTIRPDGKFYISVYNGNRIDILITSRDIVSAIHKTMPLLSRTNVNINTGVCVMELEGHSRTVNYALFSPDGERVASVSDDGTVRLWDVTRLSTIVDDLLKKEKVQTEEKTDEIPLQDLIDQTRQRFKNRPLTPEERRTYYLDN